MKFSTLSLFSLIGAASAAIIPEDAPDGKYSFHIDQDGKEIMTYHGPFELHDEAPSVSRVQKRYELPGYDLGCDHVTMNHNDEDMAWRSARDGCNRGDSTGYGTFTWKWGSAVYYICVFSGHQGCSSDEIDASARYLNDRCPGGSGPGAGWTFVKVWNKSIGRTNAGVDFCTNM
ncbi:hypothetical protein NLG97_g836 [Lecanicillium saksenae]|uniref:Uncharacterized protein n=1 Tax=Lecanicillium saksenae TaxID=468837 RepID=A0ACC1R7E6_9HYPO|nr:hypothetical protein NLG97_g836 [Lecanicillium saksenae]